MDKKLINFLIRDSEVLKAHKENKDMYSIIASMLFNRTYEECCEKDKKGNPNPAGHKRRKIAKLITASYYLGDMTYLKGILEEFNIDYDTPDIFK